MRVPIPDFPSFELVLEEGHWWRIWNVKTQRYLEGCERPGRLKRYKLRNGDVRLNKSIDGWYLHAMVRGAGGLTIPGFPDYRLVRKADGHWGIMGVTGGPRRNGRFVATKWTSRTRGECVSLYCPQMRSTSTTRSVAALVLEAHGQPRPDGMVLQVDPDVDPKSWPEGLSWGPRRVGALDRDTVRGVYVLHHRGGMAQVDIAHHTGLSASVVSAICSRKFYRSFTADLVEPLTEP